MMKFIIISYLVVVVVLVILLQEDGVNAFTATPMAVVAANTCNTGRSILKSSSYSSSSSCMTLEAVKSDDVDGDVYSRRDALRKSATTVFASVASSVAVGAITIMPNVAYADIYDDEENARKLKRKEDGENTRKLIPKILLGGVGLSSVLIIPNLIRLGKKFISLGNDDGYGK
jgi:hypothetical protein